jgi:6-phosphogluconolactonase
VSATLEIVEDPAATCAELLVEAAAGGGQIVLAGGNTPRAAYEAAAAHRDAWEHATLWFGDERCVPPDDQRSNYLMVKQALLEPLAPVRPTVHRIEGELGPEAAANAYERLLGEAGSPEFDLLLLGLGGDGHTASLFPDQDTLSERSRLVLGVPDAGLEPFVPRVTLSLTGLALAKKIVFLVSGASKADAVAAAFGPDSKPDPHVPASLLPPLARNVTVLLDSAAAGRSGNGESS